MPNYQFNILDHEFNVSQERINYVQTVNEYKELAIEGKKILSSSFPERERDKNKEDLFDYVSNEISEKVEYTVNAFGDIFKDMGKQAVDCGKEYLHIDNSDVFINYSEIRNKYISEYVQIIKGNITYITDELANYQKYIDDEALLIQCISNSLFDELYSKYLDELMLSFNIDQKFNEFNYTENAVLIQSFISRLKSDSEMELMYGDELQQVINNKIIVPLDNIFFYILSKKFIDQFKVDGCMSVQVVLDAGAMYKRKDYVRDAANQMFKTARIQDIMFNSLMADILCICQMKITLFDKNNICKYNSISMDDVNQANVIYKVLSKRPLNEQKNMLINILNLNPSEEEYYKYILSVFKDENGEIQRLAKLMSIDLSQYIESLLMKLYDENSVDTIEKALNVRKLITNEQTNYNYENSNALQKVNHKLSYLQIESKTEHMSMDELLKIWKELKNDNFEIFSDVEKYITTEECIDIVENAVRVTKIRDILPVIQGLKLPEKSGQYESINENIKYSDFESKIQKISNHSLKRDGNLEVQNYSDDSFASQEIIIGYYYFSHLLDIITNGNVIIITDKRIYINKEGFIPLNSIDSIIPQKKLLTCNILINRTDGKLPIKLPSNKEFVNESVDFLNKLISTVKTANTESYIEPCNSIHVEPKAEHSIQTVNETQEVAFINTGYYYEVVSTDESPKNDVDTILKFIKTTTIASHYDIMLSGNQKLFKKITNARKTYANYSNDEEFIMLRDMTLFGSGKEGFVLTNKKIYVNIKVLNIYCTLPLKEITAFHAVGNDVYLISGNQKIQLFHVNSEETSRSYAENLRDIVSKII